MYGIVDYINNLTELYQQEKEQLLIFTTTMNLMNNLEEEEIEKNAELDFLYIDSFEDGISPESKHEVSRRGSLSDVKRIDIKLRSPLSASLRFEQRNHANM